MIIPKPTAAWVSTILGFVDKPCIQHGDVVIPSLSPLSIFRGTVQIPHGRADASLALVCALCGLLCIGGFYHENFETQRLLREAWSQRDAELRALSGTEGVITTCSLPVPGSSVLDILPDENEDYNKNIAQYYGFDGIRADGKCEAFR